MYSPERGYYRAPGHSSRPLAKENILSLVNSHEDAVIRPQVERACQRVSDIILEGARLGQRQFDITVCRREREESDDNWHRRQVLTWDGLIDLGLEDFELKSEFVDRRQGIVLKVSY